VLRQIGAWLSRYGESIYTTRGGPFRNGTWGGSTYHDRSIYLHVLQWASDSLRLPPLHGKILHATALTGGTVNVEQTTSALKIALSPDQHAAVDTIVKLELDSAPENEFVNGQPLQVAEGRR
jgi:alpha-L-fucosidase